MKWNTIGFEKQKKYFEQLVKSGTLAHAYLFTGPEMVGKQMFAKELFVLANSREKFQEGDPDLKLITPRVAEDETKIYIEDIRDAKAFLSLKPYYGPYKFVIINDADRLTPQAGNGLLKTLEEPTPNTVLILISSQSRTLLPTIASRCQHINFLSHSTAELATFLTDKKLSTSDQTLLISMAQGRLGWLASAIENLPEIKKSITDLNAVLRGGVAERMAYAKKIYEKESYPVILTNWLYWLYGNQQQISKAPNILKELSALNTIIAQPQYNHRLALENTLINL